MKVNPNPLRAAFRVNAAFKVPAFARLNAFETFVALLTIVPRVAALILAPVVALAVSTLASGVAVTDALNTTDPLVTLKLSGPPGGARLNPNPLNPPTLILADAASLSTFRKNPLSYPNPMSRVSLLVTCTLGADVNAAPKTAPAMFCKVRFTAVGVISILMSHQKGEVPSAP